jgi:hypothetical protein
MEMERSLVRKKYTPFIPLFLFRVPWLLFFQEGWLVWLVNGLRAGSSWLLITKELKSWLGSEPSELTSFEFFFVPPYARHGIQSLQQFR